MSLAQPFLVEVKRVRGGVAQDVEDEIQERRDVGAGLEVLGVVVADGEGRGGVGVEDEVPG